MAHWPPTRGDPYGQVERHVFAGVTASNTDRGVIYEKITAAAVEWYKDIDCGASDLVASGSHSQPSTRTKIAMSASNASGLTGSVYLKYQATDATIQALTSFATDTELGVVASGITAWLPPSTTTFYNLHKRCVEEFVRKMRQAIPPQPQRLVGAQRLLNQGPWRVNDAGDYELVRLQNLDDYREWALHWTLAHVFKLPNRIRAEVDQLQAFQDEMAMAEKAWAEVSPMIDEDHDYDADAIVNRFRIARG